MQTVVFLGSKPIGYYCLAYLIEQQANLGCKVIGVLSNDNAMFNPQLSVKALSMQHQIPIIDSLDNLPYVDILISVQYHQILKPHHIAKAKLALNLHMAPLPEYRGCNQFSVAIIDDAKIFGTTIHQLDAKIDHGAIAFESRFAIPENCWISDLYNITEKESVQLFKQSLEKIIANQITWTSQESLIDQRGTSIHYRNEIHALKQIDLDWSANKIQRHIRATYMPGFEPPYALINNQKIYITLDNPNA
jgi:methionyl-tRNA formyltransferase